MNDSRLVYSTEFGRACPECGRPIADCLCARTQPLETGDGIVRVQRESKGHNGKTVTVISGIRLQTADLEKLAGRLKRRCGTGGSAKDGLIIIQGDHRELLVSLLDDIGYRVKLSGG
jgi:translation initiation factor 1